MPDNVQCIAQPKDHGHRNVEIFCLCACCKTFDVARVGTAGLLDGKRNATRNQFSRQHGHVDVAAKHECKIDVLCIKQCVEIAIDFAAEPLSQSCTRSEERRVGEE